MMKPIRKKNENKKRKKRFVDYGECLCVCVCVCGDDFYILVAVLFPFCAYFSVFDLRCDASISSAFFMANSLTCNEHSWALCLAFRMKIDTDEGDAKNGKSTQLDHTMLYNVHGTRYPIKCEWSTQIV